MGALFFVSLFVVSYFFSTLGLNGFFISDYFVFDFVGLALSLISLVLYFSLICWGVSMGVRCRIFIFFSVLMSLFCYCSCNMVVFWVTYELSILPLLYLLVVESPYSERFVAAWYLGGYIVFTSVPMVVSIFYLGGWWGNLGVLQSGSPLSGWGVFIAVLVLCVSFVTKIPLFPFHSWLPIVHAESNSSVSVCLSGFIMKLGVLGVFRFGFHILPSFVFSYWYVLFIFFLSLIMFLYSCQELDGKRWLAFLSLAHIVVCVLGLNVCNFSSFQTPFIFCLGHGFSAGATFLLLWLFYDVCGSRNWCILKSGSSSGLVFRFLVVSILCTVASFPPSLSFFSEVRIFLESGVLASLIFFVFYIYLFLGGLIPLFVLGGCISMHNSISCFGGYSFYSVISLVFLIFFCGFLFFLI